MQEIQSFFSAQNTQQTINKFLDKLNSCEPKDDFSATRNRHIKHILLFCINNSEMWDTKCKISIQNIGKDFVGMILEFRNDLNESGVKEYLDMIFFACFYFYLEFYLSMSGKANDGFYEIREFSLDNISLFHMHAQRRMQYICFQLPIDILKSLLNDEGISNFKEFNRLTSEAGEKAREWNIEITNREKRVNELKEALKSQELEYNLVLLNKAFDYLVRRKRSEKRYGIVFLNFFGFLVLLPVILELYMLYSTPMKELTEYKDLLLMSLVPTASLVALLIYFFRILLVNYKSVKSQILQLELRMAVSQFIQDYVKYSSQIKKEDANALEKFENMIFSGLVVNDDKLPSTFDGIDQIASLIKQIRS